MYKILVTGASGFIGSRLCDILQASGYEVVAAHRSFSGNSEIPANNRIQHISVGQINSETQWQEALRGVDYVIHLAARVHVMKDYADDPLAEFRKTNVFGTVNLARQAADSGVKRFIYISSIKVQGESTSSDPFKADDPPNPTDPYSISKLEAEYCLRKLGTEYSIDIVIVRSPLVYGPGVKGNFLRLMALINSGLPLPLARINNARSIVFVDNLCDLLIRCVEHPDAAGEIFLVSDGHDISTTELINIIGTKMGGKARVFPFPYKIICLIGRTLGKGDALSRLFESLQVDIDKTIDLLDWKPLVKYCKGIEDTVNWYMKNK